MIESSVPAISVRGLSKVYGKKAVLDDVSFDVERGRVTAMLGPNGAGKSTTLRAMFGLVPASSGEVLFGGRRYLDLPAPARVVGVLLDPSAMHPGRSVGETVATTAMLAGVPTRRASECLEQVGLAEVRRRRVGALSLGMRQRLGLAIALLGRPGVLVLDEPGNGLDPEGMRWLHEMLVHHARTGGAVLLSSHHLAEVDRMADDIVVLDRGSLVRELSGSRGCAMTKGLGRAAVTSSDDGRLLQALATDGVGATFDAEGLVVDADPAVVGEVARAADIALRSLVDLGDDLETAFLAVTRGEHRGHGAPLPAVPSPTGPSVGGSAP